MKEIISTNDAPAAIGPYSQAVRAGNTVYLSGQIALNPKNGELVTSSISSETEQVLTNLVEVLRAAGMTTENVVKCTIFLSSMDHYAAVNEVYGKYFAENPPAREAVAVKTLPKQVNVEISAIATD
jgi:2-iminobutanoate/2-iminopropanoate deaminase